MIRVRRLRTAARRAVAGVALGEVGWRGSAAGMAIAAIVVLVAAGLAFASRHGAIVDALTGLVVGFILVSLLAALLLLVGVALRWIPLPLRAFGIAAIVVVSLPFSFSAGQPGALVIAAVIVGAAALAGAGIFRLATREPTQMGTRVAALSALSVGVTMLIGVGAWMVEDEGPSDAADAAPSGPFAVLTLRYGSGAHPWREEFGAAVEVRTSTVDGSRLLTSWQGLPGDMRSEFWGFGPDELPLNATVWYPDAEGRFPLVLVVHGNARMEMPSDTGYGWLAADLASRGYVVASVDQNFLNSSITRLDLEDENDARAWLLLEHLRLWQHWQGDPGNPLNGLADLERIALVGQSRAGEAAATAAFLNTLDRYPEDAAQAFHANFGIRAVVSIAGNDGLYQPAGQRPLLSDVSYLAIHGGLDHDVPSFSGLKQYQRTSFSGDHFGVRSAVYLPQANHGQFNTEWGRFDAVGPARLLLDTRQLMPPAEQRAAGRAAIAAFLDAVLHGDRDGLGLLQDPDHPDWPRSARPILRYADHSEMLLAGFDEDADPTTGTLPGTRLEGHGLTVWRERPAPLRDGDQGSNVVVLGWSRQAGQGPPQFSIHLPVDWSVPAGSDLVLTLVDSGQAPPGLQEPAKEPVDFTIQLVDADGLLWQVGIGELGGMPLAQAWPRLKAPLRPAGPQAEPIARSLRIPLEGNGQFRPSLLREVRLVFDMTPAGLIHLEDVALTSAQ